METPAMTFTEPSQPSGLSISGDGRYIFFLDRVYESGSNGWYNPTVGSMEYNTWFPQAPLIADIDYPEDYEQLIEDDSEFDATITVSDTQGCSSITSVSAKLMYNGELVSTAALRLASQTVRSTENECVYTLQISQGSTYPDGKTGYIQYSVEDEDGKHSLLERPMFPQTSTQGTGTSLPLAPILNILIFD